MAIHKVLVVDDSRTEQMYLTGLLQKMGMQVRSAGSAEDAYKQLEAEKQDLILMDVVMPGRNGFQLTRIMCTSKNQETDRVWGIRQGAKDYITKPVSGAELSAKIRALG